MRFDKCLFAQARPWKRRSFRFLCVHLRHMPLPRLPPETNSTLTVETRRLTISLLAKRGWKTNSHKLHFLNAKLGGPTLLARVGVLRALNRHVERVFNAFRK